ncbi:hypothetical protein GOV07_03780 [Candidatus Woesearchaeota archaeon]|nr:hypothetical protein [Candidatus Woesearchaeota archaeon]
MKNKTERVLDILKKDRDKAFDARALRAIFNEQFPDKISDKGMSKIVTRVINKRCLRTPTQLRNGYVYTYSNPEIIRQTYDEHLLPYNVPNKKRILELIKQKSWGKLKKLESGLKNAPFLSTIVGFSMGDGSLYKPQWKTGFFFFLEKDCELLAEQIKNKLGFTLTKRFKDGCFRLECANRTLFKFLRNIGVPEGNKVYRPFEVPYWILHGEKEIKREFLRGIIGAEGSKPINEQSRIQFVISKNDLYLENLLVFLNQLRQMLRYFSIKTTHPQIRSQEGREFHGRFYITGKENVIKFYKEIGFAYASEKQEALDDLIQTYKEKAASEAWCVR